MKSLFTVFIVLLFPIAAFCGTSHAYSNSPICSGDTLRLSDTGVAGSATYFWHGPAGFTSSLQYPVIPAANILNAGVYTCIVNGTDSSTTTVVVNVTPPVPTIAVTPPICSGNTLNLVCVDTPGATYQWRGPNSFTSGVQNPTIVSIPTAATGMYTLIATYGGCSAPPAYVYVLVDSTPAIPSVSGTTPICSDSTLVLQSSCATPGVSFRWGGPDTFSAVTDTARITMAQTLNSGNYTVTVTKGICSNSGSVLITVNQKPSTPVLSSTSPVCSGGLLTLGATASPATGTWYWSGPNGFTSNSEYPAILSVSTYASGIYTAYEISNGCKSPLSTISVVINSTPDVPLEWSNAPVCAGANLTLFSNDDTAGVSYSWAGPAGFISLDQNPVIYGVTVGQAGIYTVTATLGSCSATQQVTANIIPAPPLVPSSNSPVCTGDTLKLQATSGAGNTYYWTGPFSFTGAGSGPNRSPVVTEYAGVYYVTVTDDNGCTTTATDTVVVHVTPSPPWVNWLTFCQYSYSPPLMAVDATNVLWYPSSAGTGGTTVAPTPNTNATGIYFFYLNQTMNGCPSAVDSIQVIVNPKPVVLVSSSAAAICPHDSLLFTTTDADKYDTYRWFPSFYLSDSVSASVTAKPITTSTYKLVTTNEFGCNDTEYTHVVVYPAAVVSLNAGDSVSISAGESYQISPVTNCNTFEWFPPAGLNDPTLSNPVASPVINTVYYVLGSTNEGCVAIDSIAFHVSDAAIYGVPNAFAPGNGTNNEFRLYKRGQATLNYFRIFNRWGQLVFETNNVETGWDGTFNGAAQPLGVYVYEIQAVSGATGKIETMKGNLTLLR